MAEVLGFVSGVITITETAIKLSGSVLKLKRLWDEVQDVPHMINIHIEQLQILAPTLDEMDYDFQQTRSIVQGDMAAKVSLEYCRRAFDLLEKLIRDMESQILSARKGKRTFSKGKVIFKRHVISDYERRLQFALQLVGLSQQAYTSALSRIRHSILMSELQALEARLHEREQCLVRTDQDDTDTEVAANNESFQRGTCECKSSVARSSKPNFRQLPWTRPKLIPWLSYMAIAQVSSRYADLFKVYQARFQLPDWLTRKAWGFQVFRAYDGWQFRLTPWSTRPWNSKVFRYAELGETDKLLAAFKANEASLYDRDPYGQTLLGFALIYRRLELIKFLTSMGLSVKDVYFGGQPIGFWYRMPRVVNSAEELNFFRPLFDDEGPFSNELEDALSYGRVLHPTIRHLAWNILGLVGLILASYNWNLDFWVTFGVPDFVATEPRVAMDILVSSNITPKQFRMEVLHSQPAISFPLAYIVMVPWLYLNKDCGLFGLRKFGRWMFSGASILEIVRQFGENPTSFLQLLRLWCAYMVEDRVVDGRRFLMTTVRMWLEDLMEAGVDLEAYGHWEASRLLNCDWDESLETWFGGDGKLAQFGPYVESFEYGPRLEDWKIEYDPCIEEYAGEFWTLVFTGEGLPGPIPGAWVEEDK